MSKAKCIRHGEICFKIISKLPNGLKQSKTKVIVRGSHNNDHTFDKGKLYLLEKEEPDFVFGYFVAKNTTLFHPEHGVKGKAPLPDGKYELIKQHEYTPKGLRVVID